MATPDGSGNPFRRRPQVRNASGEPDVLAPRSFWPLPYIERDRLTFSKIIERGLLAGGIVKEVLEAVAPRMKPKPLSFTSRLMVPFIDGMWCP